LVEPELIVRPAGPGDAEACRAIYAPFVEKTWISFEEEVPTVREMRRRIEGYGASHGWVVAERDGDILGYAYGSPHRLRHAYRFSCDVAIYLPETQAGKGVGRALYAVLLPMLAAHEIHAAYAGIALPNDASIALHEAVGFTKVGVYHEVGWKFDAWHDVGWWQKVL
jgi:phosphinothricin acetyltransferase